MVEREKYLKIKTYGTKTIAFYNIFECIATQRIFCFFITIAPQAIFVPISRYCGFKYEKYPSVVANGRHKYNIMEKHRTIIQTFYYRFG